MIQPVFLVGARCCGKTTTGKMLAQMRGLRFIDTDHWLSATTQLTVAQIVEQEGWTGFRARESEALRAVSAPATVIATGGGMVLAEANRQFMRNEGVVVYLSAPVAILVQRLEADSAQEQRPTLTGKPVSQEVAEVLAARDALYRQVAHHVVDASQGAPQVVAEVLRQLQRKAAG